MENAAASPGARWSKIRDRGHSGSGRCGPRPREAGHAGARRRWLTAHFLNAEPLVERTGQLFRTVLQPSAGAVSLHAWAFMQF